MRIREPRVSSGRTAGWSASTVIDSQRTSDSLRSPTTARIFVFLFVSSCGLWRTLLSGGPRVGPRRNEGICNALLAACGHSGAAEQCIRAYARSSSQTDHRPRPLRESIKFSYISETCALIPKLLLKVCSPSKTWFCSPWLRKRSNHCIC